MSVESEDAEYLFINVFIHRDKANVNVEGIRILNVVPNYFSLGIAVGNVLDWLCPEWITLPAL